MQKYPNRKSPRLLNWDYTSTAYYFVTICTKNKQCFLGKIIDDNSQLSEMGEIVADEWIKTSSIRKNVELGQWVVMPNHIHGIIYIDNGTKMRTAQRAVPTVGLICNSLGAIVGQFKTKCTKRIWAAGYKFFAWQPRYYDHIVRDEEDSNRINEYIINNPKNWRKDTQNPEKH